MKMERMMIQFPARLKAKLDAKRTQGYTASGFIRAVLERELKQTTSGQKGR
jgi:metal-responsive CopG/Arc/MetJ family transcriptional regulator